jgi:hypothetical protein
MPWQYDFFQCTVSRGGLSCIWFSLAPFLRTRLGYHIVPCVRFWSPDNLSLFSWFVSCVLWRGMWLSKWVLSCSLLVQAWLWTTCQFLRGLDMSSYRYPMGRPDFWLVDSCEMHHELCSLLYDILSYLRDIEVSKHVLNRFW